MSANSSLVWDHSAIKKHKLFGTAKLNILGDKGFTRGRGLDEKRDGEYARVAEEINKLANAKGMQVKFLCKSAYTCSDSLSKLFFIPCRASRRCP